MILILYLKQNQRVNDVKRLIKHNSIVKIGNNKPQYIVDKAFWQLWKELPKSN